MATIDRAEAQQNYRTMVPEARRTSYSVLLVGPAYDTGSALITSGNNQVDEVRSLSELQSLYSSADPSDPDSGVLYHAYSALPPTDILSNENPILLVTTGGTATADYEAAFSAVGGDSRVFFVVAYDRTQVAAVDDFVANQAAAGVTTIPVTTLDGITGTDPADHINNYNAAAQALAVTSIAVWPAENLTIGGTSVDAQVLAAMVAGQAAWSAPQQDPRQVELPSDIASPDMSGAYATAGLALAGVDPEQVGLYMILQRPAKPLSSVVAHTTDISDFGHRVVVAQKVRESVRQAIVERLDEQRNQIAGASSPTSATQSRVATLLSNLRDNWRADGLPGFTSYTIDSVERTGDVIAVEVTLGMVIGFLEFDVTVNAEVA